MLKGGISQIVCVVCIEIDRAANKTQNITSEKMRDAFCDLSVHLKKTPLTMRTAIKYTAEGPLGKKLESIEEKEEK